MAVMPDHDPAPAGIAALEGADWDGARLAFEAALDDSEAPEAHEGLGLALAGLPKIMSTRWAGKSR